LGQPDHPEVKHLIEKIAKVATNRGIPFAAGLYNPQGIQEWIDLGINWIVVGGDIGFMKKSAEDALKGTKELFNKSWKT
jgi:2-keto-3-deoxy-L-rhamnonate aldolase RhmA